MQLVHPAGPTFDLHNIDSPHQQRAKSILMHNLVFQLGVQIVVASLTDGQIDLLEGNFRFHPHLARHRSSVACIIPPQDHRTARAESPFTHSLLPDRSSSTAFETISPNNADALDDRKCFVEELLNWFNLEPSSVMEIMEGDWCLHLE